MYHLFATKNHIFSSSSCSCWITTWFRYHPDDLFDVFPIVTFVRFPIIYVNKNFYIGLRINST